MLYLPIPIIIPIMDFAIIMLTVEVLVQSNMLNIWAAYAFRCQIVRV